jgi:hypothetical protein
MKHPAIQEAENNEAILAVILSIVLYNQCLLAKENGNDIVKCDTVLLDISLVLLFIPFKHSGKVATNVATNKAHGFMIMPRDRAMHREYGGPGRSA